MALSPASFRRRVAYDIITDYIIAVLDDDRELMDRKARLEVIPSIIASLLEKIPDSKKLRGAVKRCIEYYRTMGITLPDLDADESVASWFRKILMRGEEETDIDYMRKVAIAAACILSYACIEEAIITGLESTMY